MKFLLGFISIFYRQYEGSPTNFGIETVGRTEALIKIELYIR